MLYIFLFASLFLTSCAQQTEPVSSPEQSPAAAEISVEEKVQQILNSLSIVYEKTSSDEKTLPSEWDAQKLITYRIDEDNYINLQYFSQSKALALSLLSSLFATNGSVRLESGYAPRQLYLQNLCSITYFGHQENISHALEAAFGTQITPSYFTPERAKYLDRVVVVQEDQIYNSNYLDLLINASKDQIPYELYILFYEEERPVSCRNISYSQSHGFQSWFGITGQGIVEDLRDCHLTRQNSLSPQYILNSSDTGAINVLSPTK